MYTLQACLKELTLHPEPVLLSTSGYHWRPVDLLKWLGQHFPHELAMQVHLVPPTASSPGGLFELDQQGEPVSSLPFYWIDRLGQASATPGIRQEQPALVPSLEVSVAR